MGRIKIPYKRTQDTEANKSFLITEKQVNSALTDVDDDISNINDELDAKINSDRMKFTAEGGLAIKMTASEALNVGELVSIDPSGTTYGVHKQTSGFDAFGAVYADASAGEDVWVVIAGRAQVQLASTSSSTKGHVLVASDTDGMAYTIAVPSASPAVAEHFIEVGHCLTTDSSGSLIYGILHFN